MVRVVTGALVGAIPGVVMVLLTIPVSGEAELTVGVTGILVGILGMVVGALLGAIFPRGKGYAPTFGGRGGGDMRCNRCGTLNPEGASFCSQCGTPLASTQPPPSTSPVQEEAQAGVATVAWVPTTGELASLGQRAGSWIIDWVLQAIPYIGLIPAIINGVLYRRGTTIGLSFVSARIIRENGDVSGFYHTAARAMAALLSILPLGLGYWWAFWDPKRQTWHDKMMHTYVLRNTPELEARKGTSSQGAVIWFWAALAASLVLLVLVVLLILVAMAAVLGSGPF